MRQHYCHWFSERQYQNEAQQGARDIIFSLVVDDFGVLYGSQSDIDIDHLERTLNSNDYEVTIRPEGDQYLGMNIAFNTIRPHRRHH